MAHDFSSKLGSARPSGGPTPLPGAGVKPGASAGAPASHPGGGLASDAVSSKLPAGHKDPIKALVGGFGAHAPAGGSHGLGSAVQRRRSGSHGGASRSRPKPSPRKSGAGQARRAQSVRAAAGKGGSRGGVDGHDFKGLTKKMESMGITRQEVKGLSQKYGVPERMILGVMMQESKGDPKAGSSAGARGLMQLMPATARGLGVKNINDPHQNLEGGVKYLGQMMKQFHGNETNAMAAYNAGPGRVQHAGGVPQIRETQNYVRIINGNMGAAQAAVDAWH